LNTLRKRETSLQAPHVVRKFWIVLWAACVLALGACKSTVPRQDPTGKIFPSVVGTALDDTRHRIPEDFAGSPVLLLVGYKMDSQFDIDRWLLGLQQARVKVRRYEVPTIPGMVPRMFSGFIDGGMRSGIPSEDWGGVVTVYGDASAIVDFLGNETPLPGRAVLLDAEGRVVFFHDRGYSVGTLERLQQVLGNLRGGASGE
jgi:hypothetical protein